MNLYPDLLEYLYVNHLNDQHSIRTFALLNKQCNTIALQHIEEKENRLYQIVLDQICPYSSLFKTIIYQSRVGSKKIVCEYYRNIIYSKIHYSQNKKQGLYQLFAMGSTKLIAKGYYYDNKLIGTYERWSKYNNRYYAKYSYTNGKKEGLFNSFHPNGQLKTQFYYLNNKIEGLCQRWSPDGNLILHCHYVKGKLHGLYQKWYYDGQLRLHCYYINNMIDQHKPYQKFPCY